MLIKDWILCLICVAAMVFLFCSCEWKAAKYSNKWRILFLLPAITCILHFILLGEELCLLGIYLGGWIAGIGFFTVKASVRRRSLVTAMVLCCLSVPVCYCSDSYRKPNGNLAHKFSACKSIRQNYPKKRKTNLFFG